MVNISGALTSRVPCPSNSSKPPTHWVEPAMIALSFGNDRFSSAKNAFVFSRFSNFPFPVRKNDQP